MLHVMQSINQEQNLFIGVEKKDCFIFCFFFTKTSFLNQSMSLVKEYLDLFLTTYQ